MIDPITKGIDDLGNSLLQALNNVQGFFGKELSVANPIHESVLELIGNTPLIKLNKIGTEFSKFQFYLKAEFLNPTGSLKDRTALALFADAEKKGKLKPGMIVILAMATTTARSLTWIGKYRGYSVQCLVALQTPKEKVQELRSYGAEVIVTNESERTKVIQLAKEKAQKLGAWFPDEEENPAIPNFHFKTTGPELWRDFKGNIDAVVSAPGTGGAITGIGRFLKSQKPDLKVILAGRESSPFFQYHKSLSKEEKSKIHLPSIYDPLVSDAFYPVSTEEALHQQADLYEKEGIFAGLTTGTVIAGALRFAEAEKDNKWEGGKFQNIVILSPDKN